MPLYVRFASAELREICERIEVAQPRLGPAAARRLRARLSDLRAATVITEIKVGRPKINRQGRVVFHLSDEHRIVLVPAVKPFPRDTRKEIDWSAIDLFEIVEIS
jgi:hypothetical protein